MIKGVVGGTSKVGEKNCAELLNVYKKNKLASRMLRTYRERLRYVE